MMPILGLATLAKHVRNGYAHPDAPELAGAIKGERSATSRWQTPHSVTGAFPVTTTHVCVCLWTTTASAVDLKLQSKRSPGFLASLLSTLRNFPLGDLEVRLSSSVLTPGPISAWRCFWRLDNP